MLGTRAWWCFTFFCAIWGGCYTADAQTWATAANHPGHRKFVAPPDPVIFVASPIHDEPYCWNHDGNSSTPCITCHDHDDNPETPCAPVIRGEYNSGIDALFANNPSPGSELWIIMPSGVTRKLFPLSVHAEIVDTVGPLSNGSVVEPNMSEDGTKVYFSFFHDATLRIPCNEGYEYCLQRKGADLYSIDLAPLLAGENFDPENLVAKRLTTRVNDGSGYQSVSDRDKRAMNQLLAATTGPNQWGNVYMHPIEMRTAQGLKLLFVSDEKRMRNSNQRMSQGDAGHNFNIHIADINDDGSISNISQFQYYTTTSGLSLAPLRNGFAFSYQANTEDARSWQIQGMNSIGKWYPILGYGANPELLKLGTMCVKSKGENPGDYFIAARYYNQNNQAFGTLWGVDLAKAGINSYDGDAYLAAIPKQTSSYLVTSNSLSHDEPSHLVGDQYRGKFTTPRCGKADELYFSYTPTTANEKYTVFDPITNTMQRGIYHPYIGYRPNLEPFDALDAVSLSEETGLRIVIDDSSDQYGLFWPTPVLSWQQRSGDAEQRFDNTVVDPANGIIPGQPFGVLGTSALDNTDRHPFDCLTGFNGERGTVPFSPNVAPLSQENDRDVLINNTDGLTYVHDQNNFCADILGKDLVMGVRVNITSNKANLAGDYNPGHTTDGYNAGYHKEAAKLLGVYSVVGQSDTSFKAIIPANTPFDLHLLSKEYGMKLTDVRSWHALKPRESRYDCGGCHEHREGRGIPIDGKYADTHPPQDLTNSTPYVEYDAQCRPYLESSALPALSPPEWKADIYPGFNQYCGGCHNQVTATLPQAAQAQVAFSYSNEITARGEMIERKYAMSALGAIGSSAWWAARGKRTDGRDNTIQKYQPYWDGGPNNPYEPNYGFRHTPHPNLCDGSNPEAARWVRKFGEWIDYHLPRDTGAAWGFKSDQFHPTVDGALTDTTSCSPSELNVGFWDDSGTLSEIKVLLNDTQVALYTNRVNGSFVYPLSGLNSSDQITVIAKDAAQNRQMYEKTVEQLIVDCQLAAALPTPTPSPDAGGDDPGADPSPSPGGDSLALTVGSSNYQPGQMVVLNITGVGNSSFELFGSTGGVSPGQDLSGGHVDLNPSQLFTISSSILRGQLVNGSAQVKLRIPKNFNRFDLGFDFQARGVGGLVSNLVHFAVIPTQPGIKASLLKLDKSQKKLKSKFADLKKQKSKAEPDQLSKIVGKIVKIKEKLKPFALGKRIFRNSL